MSTPNYLVQTEDGTLHTYYTLSILMIDLAIRSNESVKLYKLEQRGFKTAYVPITKAELKEMAA